MLKAQELKYWEGTSYMDVIIGEDKNILEKLHDRIYNIDGVKINEFKMQEEDKAGQIKCIYDGEEYELFFHTSETNISPMCFLNFYHFTEEEKNKFKEINDCLSLFMDFKEDVRKSFHLQLKFAIAMIPDNIGIFDESSERMLPPKWVKMIANSKILPSARDIYNVQGVYDSKTSKIWLHTHGLLRCGITELEILEAREKNSRIYSDIIFAYGDYLIDTNNSNKVVCIAKLKNNMPLVVTHKLWTEGLKEYKDSVLGGEQDRKEYHNTKTSIIFVYENKENLKKDKVSKINIYEELLNKDLIYLVSEDETKRMRERAIERFDYLKNYFTNEIYIKIGLPIENNSFEYVWFKLEEVKEDKFKGILTHDTYYLKDIGKGYEMWFKKEDITDWNIILNGVIITPSNAYLLM